MKLKNLLPLLLVLPLSGVFYGCASGTGTGSASSTGNASAASDAGAKAEQKISMAIGQEVGTFTIASQQKIESPGGTQATQYTVRTRGGKTFKCDIFEPSGFGKVMSWGMASGSSAMCTDFTAGSADQGKTNKASCNALLKAAGKC